jgi:hypothetical protein
MSGAVTAGYAASSALVIVVAVDVRAAVSVPEAKFFLMRAIYMIILRLASKGNLYSLPVV